MPLEQRDLFDSPKSEKGSWDTKTEGRDGVPHHWACVICEFFIKTGRKPLGNKIHFHGCAQATLLQEAPHYLPTGWRKDKPIVS